MSVMVFLLTKNEYKNFEIEVLLKQLNAISELNNVLLFQNQLSIINELLENSVIDKLDNQVIDISTLDF